MKNPVVVFLMLVTFVAVCLAKQNVSPNGDENEGEVLLKAGTKMSAQLQQTIDVENAKTGDDFVLKLTQDVQAVDDVIPKGTELLGRVVRAKAISPDEKTSEISLSFDMIKLGDDYLRFKAGFLSGDQSAAGLTFAASPVYKNATVISQTGKNVRLEEGAVFELVIDLDVVKN